jgi:Fe-S cluster biogenesis protein NfuA/nitrite reductase/ring-hydroxylating ferredoxin subunit
MGIPAQSMDHRAEQPSSSSAGLDELLKDIQALETITAEWDEHKCNTVEALRRADDALHKEGISRLIKAVKQVPEAMIALKEVVGDEVVYAVLRHLDIVKPSLHERVEQALDSVRPYLGTHGGNVELVEITPPETVTIRLLGACDGCPASGLTLREGVEKAIKEFCPEITTIKKARGGMTSKPVGGVPVNFVSPFANSEDEGWVYAALFDDIPEKNIKVVTVHGNEVLLSRFDEKVTCYQNACAHLGMPLDMGEVRDGILICPHHAFEYLLESGECLTAPEVQLQTHAVRVVGEKVEIKFS